MRKHTDLGPRTLLEVMGVSVEEAVERMADEGFSTSSISKLLEIPYLKADRIREACGKPSPYKIRRQARIDHRKRLRAKWEGLRLVQ